MILKLSWDYYPTNCYDICWAACEQLQRFHTFLKSLRWFESRAKVSRPTIIIIWPGRWLEDLIFETIFFLIGASVLSYRRGVIGRISLRIFFWHYKLHTRIPCRLYCNCPRFGRTTRSVPRGDHVKHRKNSCIVVSCPLMC